MKQGTVIMSTYRVVFCLFTMKGFVFRKSK